eukprot:5882208-Alexandrium_andersonii.AAC.1
MRPPSAFRLRVGLGRGEAQVHGDSLLANVIQGGVRSLHLPEEPPTPGDEELLGPRRAGPDPRLEA